MKKSILYMSLLATLSMVACSEQESIVEENSETPAGNITLPQEAAAGELLIKFKPEMQPILDEVMATRAVSTRSGIPSTDVVLDILGTYDFERVFPIDPNNEERSREAGLNLWYLVRFDAQTDLNEAANRLSQLGEISKVQCNRTIQRAYQPKKGLVVSTEVPATRAEQDYQLNDPLLYRQWGYINRGGYPFEKDWAKAIAGADVGCEEAWKLCTGDPSIIVAVLDEGVMYDHPDLAANMWINESEEMGSTKDADGNGYAGDRYGYNFVKNNGIISCKSNLDTGHGTHVAGTIAAVNDNGIGVSGIAGGSKGNPGVKIMSCQVFDGQNSCTLAMEAKAIKYAADNGAVIIQCSWGYNSAYANQIVGFTPGPATEEEWAELYPLEKEVLDYFVHQAGSPNGVIEGGLAIFASGNEYAGISAFPACYSQCLSVSAIAADYTPSTFSNFGQEVAFSAPGGDTDYYGTVGVSDDDEVLQGSIYSTLVVNGQASYGYMEGTSMACPHVSGVAALGLSYAAKLRRHFKASEFIELMKQSAWDLNSYYDGDKYYHYNHASNGSPLMTMDLNGYKGKMGSLIKADALLKSIEGKGSEMKVPNLYITLDGSQSIDLARYFEDGASLTYTCDVNDKKVAEASIKGSVLTVKGLSLGTTQATITVSSGKKQTIAITIRKTVNGNGWM